MFSNIESTKQFMHCCACTNKAASIIASSRERLHRLASHRQRLFRAVRAATNLSGHNSGLILPILNEFPLPCCPDRGGDEKCHSDVKKNILSWASFSLAFVVLLLCTMVYVLLSFRGVRRYWTILILRIAALWYCESMCSTGH